MPKLFLSPNLIFRKGKDFYCVYNLKTGLFFWSGENLLKVLGSFRNGRRIDAKSLSPETNKIIENLIENRFLIEGEENYLNFFPAQTFYTVSYENDDKIYIALQRTIKTGEVDFEVLILKDREKMLWNLCTGGNTAREIARIISVSEAKVLEKLEQWASPEFQIVRLLPKPLSAYLKIPEPLLSPAPLFPQLKSLKQVKVKNVKEYHLSICDAEKFESAESTLSHIYRIPHPILHGKSYGEAFISKILQMKVGQLGHGSRILEIGGGRGDLSKDIVSVLKEATYIIYDLSPELIKFQKKLHKEANIRVEHVHGDAELLGIKDASVNMVVSSEAIADFSTPEMNVQQVKQLPEKYGIPVTEKFLATLKNAPERIRINLGAFRLLKEIKRVLKPNGIAVITEYGYEDKMPFLAKHLDHEEYSIHFGQLASVAEALGFEVQLTNAFEFLNFNPEVELITHSSFQAAFRILEHNNIYLPNIVYTKELFKQQLGEKADRFKNISFVKCLKEPFEIVKVLVCRN